MFFFFPDGIAPQGDVIVYQSDNENITTNVLFKDDTFWMSQKDIALLFRVDRTVISKHLLRARIRRKFSMCKNCTYCR